MSYNYSRLPEEDSSPSSSIPSPVSKEATCCRLSKIIIGVLLISSACFFFYMNNNFRLEFGHRRKIQPSSKPQNFYTILFQSDTVWMGGDSYFSDLTPSNCPVQNCLVTRDPEHLREVGDFDMLLFLAEGKFIQIIDAYQEGRRSSQIYSLIFMEPPHIVGSLTPLNDMINWTIGYRRDSDVEWAYSHIYEKGSYRDMSKYSWSAYNYSAPSEYIQRSDIISLVAGKKKPVAWMVSNCNRVVSKRMELARAMQKYIPVDIYGRCGDLTCAKDDPRCFSMMDTDYFFYLSFENSLCKDYITEKTFRALEQNIVPVILNLANLTSILPPHSYILVEDFATVKELTDYLWYLIAHPEEYIKYFWWKQYFGVTSFLIGCEICKKLNEWDKKEPVGYYADLEEWYREGTCRQPKIQIP